MAGVATRWRSLTGRPLASSNIAFKPEPPISIEMVIGLEVLGEEVRPFLEDLIC